MAKNNEIVNLDTKKFSGLVCNKRANQGAVLAVITALLSGVLIAGNAANISLFQSFSGGIGSFFGGGLGQIFVGNTAQSIINTAFAIGNVALEVGVIAPLTVTAIHKAYGWSQYRKAYKSATKFQGNSVENGVTVDKELSMTKDLVNSVLYSYSVNGAKEHTATFDLALNTRNQLNNTKNPFIKIFYLHKAIAYEDCNKRVITTLTNRLAQLCYQRKNDWKYIDQSGRRKVLGAEEIRSREAEIKMVQSFLHSIVNKNDNIDPYVKTIVRQVKKHKNIIELTDDKGINDRLRKNSISAKDYVIDIFNNQENNIFDENSPATIELKNSVGATILSDTR